MTTGQIHDLGYKRYLGTRRSLATRWTVIMRHQLATSWKTWWRFKVWLFAAVVVTAVAAGFLVFASDQLVRGLAGAAGTRLADVLLPEAVRWYQRVALVVSLIAGTTVVAGDIQSGAFTFYFARSVRPRDYVLGKLAGLGLLMSLVMLVGPVVLAGLRIGLSDGVAEMAAMLPILPRAIAVGLLGTLVFTAVPLGFSALVANRRHAMALWSVYYIVIGIMALGIGIKVSPAVGAIDVELALRAVALELLDPRVTLPSRLIPPVGAAVISIVAHVAIAIGLVFWRVRRAQRTGVGGGS